MTPQKLTAKETEEVLAPLLSCEGMAEAIRDGGIVLKKQGGQLSGDFDYGKASPDNIAQVMRYLHLSSLRPAADTERRPMGPRVRAALKSAFHAVFH
jgi:hypothetical protein